MGYLPSDIRRPARGVQFHCLLGQQWVSIFGLRFLKGRGFAHAASTPVAHHIME